MVVLAACSMWFVVGELKPIPLPKNPTAKGRVTPTPSPV